MVNQQQQTNLLMQQQQRMNVAFLNIRLPRNISDLLGIYTLT